jgi:hypothetical protein
MEDIMIKADNGCRVSFDEWDESAIWMYLAFQGGSASCTIPKDQAKLMLKVLQELLKDESADQSI